MASVSPEEARDILSGIPVTDSHIHLDPKASCIEAVERFSKFGGERLLLSHKPYHDIPVRSLDGYREAFQRTVDTCKLINDKTDVQCRCIVGPYPVELIRMIENGIPLRKARENMLGAVEIAAKYVEDGDACGIGEVGRPHFPCDAEVADACMEVLTFIMHTAQRLDCCVVIHMESPGGPDDIGHMQQMAYMADEAMLDRKNIVKHFSPGYMSLPKMSLGTIPSVIARSKAILQALEGGDFMMETDFMDEPTRPDMVLPPDTVPKTTAKLMKQGKMDEERAHRVHGDLPAKVYGFE